MRPPTRGNPSLVRSTTRGACGMRPLNHGLTVWRSDELMSIACGAIRARRWLATTISAVVLGGCGRNVNQVELLATIAASTAAAAIMPHDGRGRSCRTPRED